MQPDTVAEVRDLNDRCSFGKAGASKQNNNGEMWSERRDSALHEISPDSFCLLSVLRQKPLNKSRIDLPCPEVRVRQYFAVQRDGRIHALNNKHLQRARHAGDGFVAVLA